MSAREPKDTVDLAHESDFTLGALHVHPSSRTVSVEGSSEVLEPRVMQVLVALARRRGTVLSRDELVKGCWAGRVVGDDAISRCIIRLRRLAEAHGGFVLETIPRVGYRLTEKTPEPKAAEPKATEPQVAEPEHLKPTAAIADAHLASPSVVPAAGAPQSRRPKAALLGLAAVLLAIAAVAAIVWWRSSRDRDVEGQSLAQVISLADKDQFTQAFTAARPLLSDEHIKQLPEFAAAWRRIVLPMRPVVAEPGATVSFKSYDDANGEWLPIGTTPLTQMVEAPRGVLRIKVEKPGFRTGYFAVANPGPSVETDPPDRAIVNRRIELVPLPLFQVNAAPDGMVIVPRTDVPVYLHGWTREQGGGNRLEIPSFAIDREETTNRQYKEFVDAGGYDDPTFWEGLQFAADHQPLSWEEARKRFVDATGRPGPAGWQLSTYPTDEADFPVGGISWYEAVAYARFRGKQLPTVHQWVRVAFSPWDPQFNVSPAVALASQFLAKGPRRALDEAGLGPWGTVQTLGNVREWVWNDADGKGLALGGAWSDYAPDFRFAYTLDRMQREPQNGLRLMKSLSMDSNNEELLRPIHLAFVPSHVNRGPVSDDVFDAMRLQFNAARAAPLAAHVEVFKESPLWVAEEVTLRFPSDVQFALYIVRPKVAPGKLQPIIYGPPQDCCAAKRPNRDTLEQLRVAEFVVNSGRALVMPIWMGSYERFTPADPDPKAMGDRQRRAALAWRDDIGFALDYLATREDIDAAKAGYLGFSRGSAYTVLTLAIEDRIKAAALVSGGIEVVQNVHPMIDLVNYAPRITVPVLMLNGRFDHIYPYNESQRRLFGLLGTATEQKRHIVHDIGHYAYPESSTARDATDWFDQYLGKVR